MGLNDTVSAQRIHIGFFGMRNAGKSSLVNAVTSQELSVVSDVKGTTTDPVKKSMEILPLGPVLIIDTPGLDDEGELGEKRISKARKILTQSDIAVLAVDSAVGLRNEDERLIEEFAIHNRIHKIGFDKRKKGNCEQRNICFFNRRYRCKRAKGAYRQFLQGYESGKVYRFGFALP